MTGLLGRLLMATAVGHALLGLVLFPRPLKEIFRDGFFNTVSPSPFEPTFDRECAFWFLAFSPMLFMVGWLADQAVQRGDPTTLRLVGWTLLAFGVVGAAVMPVSGQWILVLLGAVAIHAARGSNHLHGE
jgi:hypothetical protein